MKLRPWLSTPLLGLTFGFVAAGCGGISKADADAQPGDGGAGLDAGADGGVTATRKGTVSIHEIRVLPKILGAPKGLDARIEFQEIGSPDSIPVLGDDSVGGCTVWHHAAEYARAHSLRDEGAVAFSGSALVEAPPAECGWSDSEYECVVAEESGLRASIFVFMYSVHLTVSGLVFDSLPYNGAHGLKLTTSGFTNPGNNRSFLTYGTYDQEKPGEIVISAMGPGAAVVSELSAQNVSWKATLAGPVTVGFGGEPTWDGLSPDPLLPGELSVSKSAGQTIPSLSTTVTPAGQGFSLDPVYDVAEAMPFTARDITFRCEGGVCSPPTGEALELFSITGHTTTDGNYDSLDLYTMNPSLPGTTWAEFECHFIGGTSATIPAAVWAKVLETNPKRIETTVTYSSAKIFVDDGNRTMIRVGHGHRGYTTFAP